MALAGESTKESDVDPGLKELAGKEGKRQAHRHPELNIGKSHY